MYKNTLNLWKVHIFQILPLVSLPYIPFHHNLVLIIPGHLQNQVSIHMCFELVNPLVGIFFSSSLTLISGIRGLEL